MGNSSGKARDFIMRSRSSLLIRFSLARLKQLNVSHLAQKKQSSETGKTPCRSARTYFGTRLELVVG
jgi:hypothetical protein